MMARVPRNVPRLDARIVMGFQMSLVVTMAITHARARPLGVSPPMVVPVARSAMNFRAILVGGRYANGFRSD